jgi:hypothetical protein
VGAGGHEATRHVVVPASSAGERAHGRFTCVNLIGIGPCAFDIHSKPQYRRAASARTGVHSAPFNFGAPAYAVDRVQTPFSAHCDGYTSWRLETSAQGLFKPRATGTCTDQNGDTVYLKAKFVDRAEPGAHKDIARVWWSYTDPNASHAPFIKDVGAIQDGNLQYHAGA